MIARSFVIFIYLLAVKAHIQSQVCQWGLGILVLKVDGLTDAHVGDIGRDAQVEVFLKESGEIPLSPRRPLSYLAAASASPSLWRSTRSAGSTPRRNICPFLFPAAMVSYSSRRDCCTCGTYNWEVHIVVDLVKAFEQATGVKVPYVIKPPPQRRRGRVLVGSLQGRQGTGLEGTVRHRGHLRGCLALAEKQPQRLSKLS